MNLLKHVDSDIICINETHLKTTQVIELGGYQYYGHNRTSIHVNAPKGSGGVGIFVRHTLFDTFDVSVIDKSHDGILGIALSDKITSYKIAVFTTYLPPENSPCGRNATDFYSHLLGQMYLSSDIDTVILAGDLNSRIGNMSITISDIDNNPKRNCLDTAVNSHGHTFLEFLNDSNMCILNGRFKESKDNFTSVSPKGKSVVDYICIPHDNFSEFQSFQVISPSSLVAKYNLHDCIGERSRLPDHYILKCEFRYREVINDDTSSKQKTLPNRTLFNCRKFKLKQIPEAFFSSDLVRRAFLDLINRIESSRETQQNVDYVYDQFCDTLIKKMNSTIPSFHCSKRTRKRYKTYKPYWNDQLESLWKDMRQKEHTFTKCRQHGNVKRQLQCSFKMAQNAFDKV